MSAFWNIFKKGSKAVIDIRDDEIRYSSIDNSKFDSCTEISGSLEKTLEGLLAVNGPDEILVSIRNKLVYSGIVNIGHFSFSDDLYEILRWRFFHEKELQPSDFELTYIPLYSKKSLDKKENFYFVSVIRNDFLKKMLGIFESFNVKVKEILIPSYAISKAIYKNSGEKNFLSILFGSSTVMISVFQNGKPIYLQEINNPELLKVENKDHYIGFAREIFYGVSNYLTEIYENTIRPQKLFIDFEIPEISGFRPKFCDNELIRKVLKSDYKNLLTGGMKNIFRYE